MINSKRNLVARVSVRVDWAGAFGRSDFQDLALRVEITRQHYQRDLYGEFNAYGQSVHRYDLPGYSASALRLREMFFGENRRVYLFRRQLELVGRPTAVEAFRAGPLGLSLFNKVS